jgi:chitosanase
MPYQRRISIIGKAASFALGILAAGVAFGQTTDMPNKLDMPPPSLIFDEPTMTIDRPCPPPESELLTWARDTSSNAIAISNQVALPPEQEKAIQQFVTIFENSTTKFQYSSVSELKDGKGLNVGRVGFNSKAGALQELVKQYLTVHRNAPSPAQIEMKKYLPCLNDIKGTGNFTCLYPSVDFTELSGKARKSALKNSDFGKAWKDASKDPAMKELQDRFVDEHYFAPASEIANDAHLRSALGRAFIYDSVIQNGEGGVSHLVDKTQKIYEATHHGREGPTNDVEETEWLKIFNQQRTHLLGHGKVDTSSRVRSLTQLLKSGNLDLRPPIRIQYHGSFTLNSGR